MAHLPRVEAIDQAGRVETLGSRPAQRRNPHRPSDQAAAIAAELLPLDVEATALVKRPRAAPHWSRPSKWIRAAELARIASTSRESIDPQAPGNDPQTIDQAAAVELSGSSK